jgi:hypothetical protein
VKVYYQKEIVKDLPEHATIFLCSFVPIYFFGMMWQTLIIPISYFLLLIAVFMEFWKHRYEPVYYKTKFHRPSYIEGNAMIFDAGYYFAHSNLQNRKRLEASEICECCINTSPVSFIINHNEVIFAPQISREDIQIFYQQNEIFICDRIDIWERINWPFLDTEFDENENQDNEKILEANGVSKNDLRQIRKKISTAMSMNYFAWEWQYLGQFDYLHWAKPTYKKYWWSMDIALRNYKRNKTEY